MSKLEGRAVVEIFNGKYIDEFVSWKGHIEFWPSLQSERDCFLPFYFFDNEERGIFHSLALSVPRS